MSKTLEVRLYEGDRAREILENEVFTQVWADLKAEITDQWTNSPSRDVEGREKLWLMLGLLNKLQGLVQTTLETGTLAKLELEHKRKLAERLRDGASSIFNA